MGDPDRRAKRVRLSLEDHWSRSCEHRAVACGLGWRISTCCVQSLALRIIGVTGRVRLGCRSGMRFT